MINAKSTLSIAIISFVGSGVALAVMGAMAFVPLTVTVVVTGAILTAINVSIVMAVVMAVGQDVHPGQAAVQSAPLSKSDFSVIDSLTRTPNRRGITISIMDAMALGERYGNPLSVAKLDLDHLSSVNTKFGNEAGDHILAGVAAIVTEALRMPDKIGRYDDDEFLLVMPQTEIEDAYKIVDRVNNLIADQKFNVNGSTAIITASVGVTEYRQDDDLESLLSRVQKGVEESRSEGRGRVTRV